MTVAASPSLHAAEQALQSIPNPSKVREIYLDIAYYGPQGSHVQAIVIVGILALTAVVVAFIIAAVNRT